VGRQLVFTVRLRRGWHEEHQAATCLKQQQQQRLRLGDYTCTSYHIECTLLAAGQELLASLITSSRQPVFPQLGLSPVHHSQLHHWCHRPLSCDQCHRSQLQQVSQALVAPVSPRSPITSVTAASSSRSARHYCHQCHQPHLSTVSPRPAPPGQSGTTVTSVTPHLSLVSPQPAPAGLPGTP
jgi:hypothetical protein